MTPAEKDQTQQAAQVEDQQPAPAEEEDFLAGAQACDLSGEGTCEACQ